MFCDAGYLDFSQHLEETFAFVLCALINIKKDEDKQKKIIDNLIQKIIDAMEKKNEVKLSEALVDDILEMLFKKIHYCLTILIMKTFLNHQEEK